MVFIQRSKGYLNRRTLSVDEIGEMARFVKSIAPDTFVVVMAQIIEYQIWPGTVLLC